MKNKSMFEKKSSRYEIVNKKDEPTQIFLYDEIGLGGVTAETFIKDLESIKNDVVIRIKSPGGSVFDGMAIYNEIRNFRFSTIVSIDSLAASVAATIAMAGDKITMAEGAFLMIHDPYSLVIGTAKDMRKEANLLEKIKDQTVKVYQQKSKKSKEEIEKLMSAGTWYTCDEALQNGFIDEIKGVSTAENLFDLSVFNNVPDFFKSNGGVTPRPKDYEKALRDAGMSRREAKAVLSEGLSSLEGASLSLSDDEWAEAQRLILQIGG